MKFKSSNFLGIFLCLSVFMLISNGQDPVYFRAKNVETLVIFSFVNEPSNMETYTDFLAYVSFRVLGISDGVAPHPN